jgi:hypothetical protein
MGARELLPVFVFDSGPRILAMYQIDHIVNVVTKEYFVKIVIHLTVKVGRHAQFHFSVSA